VGELFLSFHLPLWERVRVKESPPSREGVSFISQDVLQLFFIELLTLPYFVFDKY
jgi:hypothetical protein